MINKLCTLYLPFKTRHKFLSRDNGKITRKKMSKLFSCDYLTAHRYDEMKCHKNINFEEVDTEPATGKNDGFLLL